MTELTGPLVLLVEDEPIILEVLEMELHDAGFDVCACVRSREALEQIEEDAGRFCAIVTDIDLGNGPNGWELARRARELPLLPSSRAADEPSIGHMKGCRTA